MACIGGSIPVLQMTLSRLFKISVGLSLTDFRMVRLFGNESICEKPCINCHLSIPQSRLPPYVEGQSFIRDCIYDYGADLGSSLRFSSLRKFLPAFRDQGQFGTCYAFAVIAALQSAMRIFRGDKSELSAQELVNHEKCSCGIYHGRVGACFDFIFARKGLTLESDYPYKGYSFPMASAQLEKLTRSGRILGYQKLKSGSKKQLLNVLARQPVLVGMRTSKEFMGYGGEEEIFSIPYKPSQELESEAWQKVFEMVSPDTPIESLNRIHQNVLTKLLNRVPLDHAILITDFEKVGHKIFLEGMCCSWKNWGRGGFFKMPLEVAETYGMLDFMCFPLLEEALLAEPDLHRNYSLHLVSDVVRTAISTICFTKGIIKDNCCRDSYLHGIKTKKMVRVDPITCRIHDWVVKGVLDALEKNYLRTLVFCICEPCGHVCEEYLFDFSYTTNEGGKIHHIIPSARASKMLSNIAQLTKVLNSLPDKWTVFLKLLYYEEAMPAEYRPPFFTIEEKPELTRVGPHLELGIIDMNHFHLTLSIKVSEEVLKMFRKAPGEMVLPGKLRIVEAIPDETSLEHKRTKRVSVASATPYTT